MEFKLINDRVIENCKSAIGQSMGKVVVIQDKKRTPAQNAYYFNILSIIGKEIGETKDELHDRLKWSVLGPDYVEIDGKQVARIKPSSRLSASDFSPLIEGALNLAMLLGVSIPPAKEFGL